MVKTKKKKRTKKDPDKPKRARTAYSFFVKEQRPRIRAAVSIYILL